MSTSALPTPPIEQVQQAYRHFVVDRNHPCVMARSLFMDEQVSFGVYRSMDSVCTTHRLYQDLGQYASSIDAASPDFQTFIAVFSAEPTMGEQQFEQQLWELLQSLNQLDGDNKWDLTNSDDPHDPSFSYSLHGASFYLVGMHPGSSRLARQAPYVTIVFNLHQQFEKLRGMGAYTRVRNRIRRRDKKLQGSVNPMMQDFGTHSEARQYSGRAVGDDWQCPFKNAHAQAE